MRSAGLCCVSRRILKNFHHSGSRCCCLWTNGRQRNKDLTPQICIIADMAQQFDQSRDCRFSTPANFPENLNHQPPITLVLKLF